MPVDGQEQTDRVYLAGQLGPQVSLHKVYLAVYLVLEHAGFESPIFTRADPDELVPVCLPAGDGRRHFLDANRAGKVLRQPQRGRVERVGGRIGTKSSKASSIIGKAVWWIGPAIKSVRSGRIWSGLAVFTRVGWNRF